MAGHNVLRERHANRSTGGPVAPINCRVHFLFAECIVEHDVRSLVERQELYRIELERHLDQGEGFTALYERDVKGQAETEHQSAGHREPFAAENSFLHFATSLELSYSGILR